MMKYTAIILAGGLATKMGDVAKEVPKCLIDTGGIPLIKRCMMYSDLGNRCSQIIVSAGHLGEQVQDYINNHPMNIHCPISVDIEEAPLGTGGALLRIFEKYGLSSAVVVNGDIVLKVSANLLDKVYYNIFRLPHDCLGLFTTTRVEDTHYYYVVESNNDNRIITFSKNYDRLNESGVVNTGLYYIKKELLTTDFISTMSNNLMTKRFIGDKFSLEREIIPEALDKGLLLRSLELDAKTFIDMTNPDDIRYFNNNRSKIVAK